MARLLARGPRRDPARSDTPRSRTGKRRNSLGPIGAAVVYCPVAASCRRLSMLLALLSPSCSRSPRRCGARSWLFTVGSGELGGGYYAAATAHLRRGQPRRTREHALQPGADAGLALQSASLRDRQLDFALTQSDWQNARLGGHRHLRRARADDRAAQRDVALPGDGHDPGRRGVRHRSRSTTCAASASTSGRPASGRNATVMRVLADLGPAPTDFAARPELPADATIGELCAGRIDATILIVGPSRTPARPGAATLRRISCHRRARRSTRVAGGG